MGEWYDVGLQAGKKVAEAVDSFIEKEDYWPKREKVLSDGSKVYQWFHKWNPYRYPDEKRFVELLRRFDDADVEDEENAYKLVAVGDEGGSDEIYNVPGYELFTAIYNPARVQYPDEWYWPDDENPLPERSFSIRTCQ